MLKRLLLGSLITLGLILAWHGPLLAGLLRPRLYDAGLVRSTDAEIGPDELRYDRLGIRAPVSVDADTSPLVESDWSKITQSLMEGVSLSYEGDTFTDARLAFVTGHSSDATRHAFDSVFAGLGQAAPGDTFTLAVDGERFDYRVVDRRTIAPADADAFRLLAPSDDSDRVALVTCWPPLTTKTRMVVIGVRL